MLWLIWKINDTVSVFLNNLVIKLHWQKFTAIMADAPIFFAPIFLVSMWIYWTIKLNLEKKKDLIFIFYSIVSAIITNLIIQHIVFEHRPETLVQPLIEHIPDASFPSDHAAVSFAFLTSLYLFGYKKTFWAYLPFVVLMNASRIAVGVHWFFDVIAGMFVGIFWAFMLKKLRKNKILNKIADFFIRIAGFFKL